MRHVTPSRPPRLKSPIVIQSLLNLSCTAATHESSTAVRCHTYRAWSCCPTQLTQPCSSSILSQQILLHNKSRIAIHTDGGDEGHRRHWPIVLRHSVEWWCSGWQGYIAYRGFQVCKIYQKLCEQQLQHSSQQHQHEKRHQHQQELQQQLLQQCNLKQTPVQRHLLQQNKQQHHPYQPTQQHVRSACLAYCINNKHFLRFTVVNFFLPSISVSSHHNHYNTLTSILSPFLLCPSYSFPYQTRQLLLFNMTFRTYNIIYKKPSPPTTTEETEPPHTDKQHQNESAVTVRDKGVCAEGVCTVEDDRGKREGSSSDIIISSSDNRVPELNHSPPPGPPFPASLQTVQSSNNHAVQMCERDIEDFVLLDDVIDNSRSSWSSTQKHTTTSTTTTASASAQTAITTTTTATTTTNTSVTTPETNTTDITNNMQHGMGRCISSSSSSLSSLSYIRHDSSKPLLHSSVMLSSSSVTSMSARRLSSGLAYEETDSTFPPPQTQNVSTSIHSSSSSSSPGSSNPRACPSFINPSAHDEPTVTTTTSSHEPGCQEADVDGDSIDLSSLPPIERYRKKSKLSVTDFSSQIWCETQLNFVLSTGRMWRLCKML
eukprot:GHVQ01013237.1.p1 GENE.GHVQ01013237.1~~GHVQ01013237.1.p1  ORF type:complete len:600 (+),score=142.52 GHVQ01013237.1:291-2090(+)